jgi:hypothetical protein
MEKIQREETPRLGVSEGIRIRIPREESTRLPSSNNSKGLWKGYPGKKPLDWGFPKNKDNLRLHDHKIWHLKDRDKGKIHQSWFKLSGRNLARRGSNLKRIPRYLTICLERLSPRSQTKVMGGSSGKIKLLQRKVKLSNLTTHLERLSLWSQTKVMGGSSVR